MCREWVLLYVSVRTDCQSHQLPPHFTGNLQTTYCFSSFNFSFSFPFPLLQNPSPSKPTSPLQDFSLVLFIIFRMVRPIYSVKPWDLDFNAASVPANVCLLGTNYFSVVIHLWHTDVIPVPRSDFLFSLQRNGNRLSKFSCTHFRLWDS
jgi:hypothetical protein